MQPSRAVDIELGQHPDDLDSARSRRGVGPKRRLNVQYIGQLVALRCWYRQVRRARLPVDAASASPRVVLDAAIENLDLCIDERVKRLAAFLHEHGESALALAVDIERPCPLPVSSSGAYTDHVTWVQSLSEADVQAGHQWLAEVADAVVKSE